MDSIIDTRTLRLVHVFKAPIQRVFAAWTDPGQFMQWMCPPGFRLDQCELDPRAGGGWRVHGYKPDGSSFAKSGVYREVRRPERLVFTWGHHADDCFDSMRGHETTVELTFRAIGDGTELTLIHGPFVDLPSFSGHTEGWKGSFTKLDGFLSGRE
jgi:glutathione S-transferase